MKYFKRIYFLISLVPYGIFLYLLAALDVIKGEHDDEPYKYWK